MQLNTKVAMQPACPLTTVTGAIYRFTRRDGVHQIPIGALAP